MSDPVYGLFVKSNNLCQALYTGYIYMRSFIFVNIKNEYNITLDIRWATYLIIPAS